MKLAVLLALASSCILAPAAEATVVTQSYTVNASFTSGPVATLTQSFNLTYDNAVTYKRAAVSSYSVSSSNAAFAGPAFFDYDAPINFLVFYGPLDDRGVTFNTNDFSTAFFIGTNIGSVIYSYVGAGTIYSSASFSVVPEPATWALMLTGFAGAGLALRRKRAIPALA